LIAEPLPEHRCVIACEDVEDEIEEHVSTQGEVPHLMPDDLPENMELPENGFVRFRRRFLRQSSRMS
jgi:hypothetical protein